MFSAALKASADAEAAAPALEGLDALEDTDLFAPPPREDCPICMHPLPLNEMESFHMTCCGKWLCDGCLLENSRVKGEMNTKREESRPSLPPLEQNCAFCRAPYQLDDFVTQMERALECNDAEAFHSMSNIYRQGYQGIPQDQGKAFELTVRAAVLGSSRAIRNIAIYYYLGDLLEEDDEKHLYYLQVAAKRGNVNARFDLGALELMAGNDMFALKHWQISTAAGHLESLNQIQSLFKKGTASKDEYTTALRAYQQAKEDEKSEERTKAKEIFARGLTPELEDRILTFKPELKDRLATL